jgi:hypothetical protein
MTHTKRMWLDVEGIVAQDGNITASHASLLTNVKKLVGVIKHPGTK